MSMRSARAIRRWSDNDRHLGPFTFAFRESWRPFAIILSSGGREDDEGQCCVRFQAFGFTMICELPQIIRPWRYWQSTETPNRLRYPYRMEGRGYWDQYPREYGFSLSDGYLSVKLGAQTHDSDTTQSWGYFLPWKQWRCIAHRRFGADGTFHADMKAFDQRGRLCDDWHEQWERRKTVEDATPTLRFAFNDYDGERNTAVTHIEEWEWRLGEGWFKWLGYVLPKKRRRSLMLNFVSEVGREKGSWKGGVMGTSIDMLPGESAESAFRRYCAEEHRSKSGRYRIQFVGTLADATPKEDRP